MTNEANDLSNVQLTTEEVSQMRVISDAFDKARNAVLEGSKLSREIAALRAEFEAFKTEMQSLRERNATLDEALTNTRRQRDEALQLANDRMEDIARLSNENHTLTENRDYWSRIASERAATIAQVSERVDNLTELSEALEKERDELRAKLELIEGVLHPQASTTVQPHPHPQPVQELSDFDKSGYNEVREDNQPF